MLALGAKRLKQPAMHFNNFTLLECGVVRFTWECGLQCLLGADAKSVYVLSYECAFSCMGCDLAAIVRTKESSNGVVCVVWLARKDSSLWRGQLRS